MILDVLRIWVLSRVGTKVFAFVFSPKFSRNLLFVFAKDSLRKDETFAKVFAKTKYLISRKYRGKNHSMANFVYLLTKNMERSQSSVKKMWLCNIFNYGGTKDFDLVFFAKVFSKLIFLFSQKKS
jgi:hypothetical protein